MNDNKVTINEMIAQMVAEARRLGYSESSIWRNIQPGLRVFAIYFGKKDLSFYDPETTNEYVRFQSERLSRNEISDYHYRNIRSADFGHGADCGRNGTDKEGTLGGRKPSASCTGRYIL